MAGLAAYLHVKTTLGNSSSGSRANLEKNAPMLAKCLVSLGLAVDLTPLEPGGSMPLDAEALGLRIFLRYAVGEKSIPLNRAIKITRLTGLGGDLGDEKEDWVGQSLSAAGVPPTPTFAATHLTSAQFVAFFRHATSSLPPSILYLHACERLGVAAAPPEALALFGELFLRVTAGRPFGDCFTPTALSALASELGWVASEESALGFIMDCKASLLARKPGGDDTFAATAKTGVVGTPAPVKVSREEFVEFMMLAAARSYTTTLPTVDTIRDAIKVFSLLHLDGLRASAGVAPT